MTARRSSSGQLTNIRQKRSVAGYLAGLEAEAQVQQGGDSDGGVLMGPRPQRPDRKPPKVISPRPPR